MQLTQHVVLCLMLSCANCRGETSGSVQGPASGATVYSANDAVTITGNAVWAQWNASDGITGSGINT